MHCPQILLSLRQNGQEESSLLNLRRLRSSRKRKERTGSWAISGQRWILRNIWGWDGFGWFGASKGFCAYSENSGRLWQFLGSLWGVPDENSRKTAGKCWTILPESRNVLNSNDFGHREGKPPTSLAAAIVRPVPDPLRSFWPWNQKN